jgi:tRNA U34 2-thiouridine synthase MnmA/TrmU
MNYERANTHELQVGDVVLNCGVCFLLTERRVYPMESDFCPDRQGDTIAFDTQVVGEVEGNGAFPKSWRKGYTIQGNKMAVWAKVIA